MADQEKSNEPSKQTEEPSADMPLPKPVKEPKKASSEGQKGWGARWQHFKGWYVSHKKLSIPASVVALLLLLLVIPFTRYPVLGTVVKKDFIVWVIDSNSRNPVSGATVSYGGTSAVTNGDGQARMHLSVGPRKVTIEKKYYQSAAATVNVPIFGLKSSPAITFNATGRQVKVSVSDKISKKPLENVDIKVLDITAKTDKKGKALLVLPTGAVDHKGTLSLDGYNPADVIIKVSDTTVAENNLSITSSGKIYFLSKLSGKIDVVKTDLDGQNRQTVLAGTGKEDDQNTVLLASRDWKYLALLSRRDSSLAKLYIIDTSNDTTKAFDEGNANFNPIGWYDDYFVYTVDRISVPAWQPKNASIKSYNAQSGQIIVLDSTDATGSSNFDAEYESILNTNLLADTLVYTKTWYKYPGYLQVSGQQNSLSSIKPDGSGKKVIKSADSATSYFNTSPHSPSSLYVSLANSGNNQTTYYDLTAGGSLNQKSDLNSDSFFKSYPTYLLSPSDKLTFWSEPRDGKNSLFVGDASGSAGKQAGTLSDYQTYGWYSDSYLLVSKKGSELYIFGADGISKDADALKVTDYHKPVIDFPGYGGGYGGI